MGFIETIVNSLVVGFFVFIGVVIVIVILLIIAGINSAKNEKEAEAGQSSSSRPDSFYFQKTNDYDDFVEWGEATRYSIEPRDLEIDYINQRGQKTTRTITLQNLLRNPDGSMLVHAHCHLRDANRTFHVERMKALRIEGADADPSMFFSDILTRTPEYAMEQLDATHPDEVAALIYLGRIDGRFVKKEKEIISRYFKEAHGLEVSPDIFPSRDYTTNAYRKTVKKLNAELPNEKRVLLKKALGEIVGKSTDEMKLAAVNMLKVEST